MPIPKQSQSTPNKNRDFYKWLGSVVLVCIGIAIGAMCFGSASPVVSGNALAYSTNIFTETLGVIGAALIIEARIRYHAAKQQREEEIARLVSYVRSGIPQMAQLAIRQLDEMELLQGKNGIFSGKRLSGLHLQNTWLNGANLRDTEMVTTHLEGARLLGTDFRGASLAGAFFAGATLWEPDFRGANLEGAFFEGAIILSQPKIDENTILPDGVQMPKAEYGGVISIDFQQYTNDLHPSFTRPSASVEYLGEYQHYEDKD